MGRRPDITKINTSYVERQPRVGAQGMADVVPLGDPLSAAARQARGAHDQAPSAGIVTGVVDKVTNARAESINAGIQKVKYSARGLRNPSDSATPSTFTSAALVSTPSASPGDPLFPPGS